MIAEPDVESGSIPIATPLKQRSLPVFKIIGGLLLFVTGVIVGAASSAIIPNSPFHQRDLLFGG